jgi:hypothetical protein
MKRMRRCLGTFWKWLWTREPASSIQPVDPDLQCEQHFGLGAAVLGLEADESYAAAARRAFTNSSNGSGLGRGNGLSDHVAGGASPPDQAANP